ncbi:MAG: MBL fold metallo-hydrolase [Candidatus Aquicultorales bacterium]
MELTIVGSSAAYPTPDRASSSYLITGDGRSLLVDIGGGSLRNLPKHIRPELLGGLLVTHLHQDHFLDIYPLYYYLKYEVSPVRRLPVFAPRGALEALGCLLGEDGADQLSSLFDFRSLRAGRMEIGGFDIGLGKMKHVEETFGVRIEEADGSIAYTSDTGYSAEVVAFASGAGLLLCEATLIEPVPGVDHLTFEEAGRLASEARVGRLVLTHIWPSLDHRAARDAAGKHFTGPIEVAWDGMKMTV